MVILRAGKRDHVAVRVVGLNDGAPLHVAATRASDDLGQHGKGALGGTVIVHVKRGVGQQDAHKRDVGEVVPFGDHLRTDHDVGLAVAEFSKQLIHGEFCRGGVRIQTHDARVRQKRLQLLLHALRAKAVVSQVRGLTRGALGGHLHPCSAPVADQLAVGVRAVFDVVGHGHRAVRAGDGRATGCAGHKSVIAAAVEKQDCLPAALYRVIQCLGEERAERRGKACRRFIAHVGHRDLGQIGFIVTLGKRQQGISSRLCLGVAFQ